MQTAGYWRSRYVRVAGLLVAAASAVLLFAASATAVTTPLYDQNNNFWVTHALGTSMWFHIAMADDFVVPPSTSWHVTSVFAPGWDYGNLTEVTVKIYPDSSGVPAASAVYTHTAYSTGAGAFTDPPDSYWLAFEADRTGGDLTVPVDVTLAPGHYWLSIMPDNTWWWDVRTVVAGTGAEMADSGSMSGTGCTTWADIATCYGDPDPVDLMFTLYGTSGPTNPLTPSNGSPLSATAGIPLTGATLGTFTDSDTTATASSFTAQVCWNDSGTPPSGDCQTATVTGSAGSFTVTGSHTFTAAGSYNAVTTITDAATNHAEIDTTITVAAPVSAQDQIAALKATISGMNLRKATTAELNEPLTEALAALRQHEKADAIGAMRDFIQCVRDQPRRALTQSQAATLISAAQAIIATLRSG